MLSLFEAGNEAAWLASFSFSVEVRPRYCECDGQGHVSNVVYPEYLELGRLQFFKAANDPEPHDFAFQHVTAELTLRYLAACFYDERLTIHSRLARLGGSSATLEQAIVGADGTLRAIAQMALVRSRDGRVAPWTD
ncbi:MAG: acyl-CoA thioesterase, partial [Candidatus Eremiobacteraeota bacterium]|nr:acyl-CoA thioesterase [Candidatus Eremiobacteraeota bacterium]